MSLPRIYLIAILLLAFSINANSQEPPKAVLVDEFGNITCEDLLGRQDYFLSELSKNPQDIGYAIIYSSGRNPQGFVKFLAANMYMRRFDRSRLQIVLSKGTSVDTSGQFWRIPPGAQLPKFDPVTQPVPNLTKPFLFGTDFSENVCPSFSPDLLAKLISENPGSYARIVISGPTWFWRKAGTQETLEWFKYSSLDKNRMKFFYIHRPQLQFIETEYWYIPAKNK